MQQAVTIGRFSVVVPSFQQGEFLERTLRSILGQDCGDVELIVQDGGSTDGSVEILRRYGSRLRWESGRDGGQSAAINAGLRKATGEFLCYVNSDDVLCAGALRRARDCFAAHPDAGIVYGLADLIDEHDQYLAPHPVEPWDYERLLETNIICQPASFWRRSVLERHGGFDESLHYAMDYDYWLRVGKTEKVVFLAEKLAAARYHARTKTFGRPIEAHREILAIVKRYNGGRIPSRWIARYARARALQQLRGGSAPLRRPRFAMAYWAGLLACVPRVRIRDAGVLLWKLAPPYASALRQAEDGAAHLRESLAPKREVTSRRQTPASCA